MAPLSDDAARQRITSHMNADHSDSVVRFAEHYANASRFIARNAHMNDISLDKITLSAGGRTLYIPLDPPMKSFSEARERVVKMDQECIAALGRDSITIKEYRAPKGFHAVIFATCFSTYILLSRQANVLPGSLLYDSIFRFVPQFAAFVLKIRLMVLYPMLALHLFEAFLMSRKLKRHSVPLFSKLWWSWCLSAFVEGVGSFQRTSAIVDEKRNKQQKH